MLNIKNVRRILKAQQGLPMPQYVYENEKFVQKYPLDWKQRMNQQLFNNTQSTTTTPTVPQQPAANTAVKTPNMSTSNVMSGIGQAADFSRGLLFKNQNNSALTQGLNSTYDAVSSSLMAFAPIGTIVGGAMKTGAFIGDGLSAMGVGTDQMTTADQILDSNFFKLTPVGLVNAFGAKKTQDFDVNQDTLDSVGGSYGGSANLISNAASKANKKYGLFSSRGRRKANKLIDNARNQQNIMTDIAQDAEDQRSLAQSNFDYNSINYQTAINGGYDMRYGLVAKEGAKLNSCIDLDTKDVEWTPIIEEVSSLKEGGSLDWVPKIEIITMKSGGKTEELKSPEIKETIQKNIIPEGALHKNKHHMENDDNITKKGIPVIDDKGNQQAEIELNEIIFTLEVTKKLEELYNKYYNENTFQKDKDKCAIEAGQLLVKEILFNTEDRTGLIDTLKQGGKIDELK